MAKKFRSTPRVVLFLFIAALSLLVSTAGAVPDAAFISNVTGGPAPLTVQFNDTSTGDPDGWTWYFGDETYDGEWTEQNASAGWSARRDHTSVVMPNGNIILMGGWAVSNSYMNDTWRSTDNGKTWENIMPQDPNAIWSARHSHAAVSVGNSIVIMSGYRGSFMNDTWRSDDEGKTWTQRLYPGFGVRYAHTAVVMPNGNITLMGGRGTSGRLNDTWQSADEGATWTRMAEQAEWSARRDHTSVVMPDGSIVLMGGSDSGASGERNDTWRSDDEGATWTQLPNAEWPVREYHTSVVMPDGSIILMGGSGKSDSNMNDVWRSTDEGTTWTRMAEHAEWSARYSHTSVVMPDGSIVLMGGSDGTSKNDVWLLETAGSNTQNSTHTYTEPGTYTVALQAYNADGCNATQKVGYITVTAPVAPTATFTANRTSGTAPLAVQFNDTSTGSPIVWNWSFGDGTWHNTTDAAERNVTHTYAAAGTYTVNLTVSNAGGDNTHTEGDYITVTAAPILPPTAAFSGTPLSGAAPLTVDFTDQSAGGPTGWAWFFGDETYADAWTERNASAGWAERTGHTSVAMPGGSIVIMGGIDGFNNRFNDTWRSDNGGATWTWVNASSGWNARLYHTSVAIGNTIVLMGGYDGTNYLNDVWRSTDGGTSWTQLPNAGWTAREGHTNVALPDGSILVIGGSGGGTRQNDIWRSENDGETWTRVTDHAEWSARHAHASVTMPDGSILVMGGEDGSGYKNDIWRSDNDGEIWTRVTEHAEWSARATHTSVAMPDGSILVMGGLANSGILNDVWRSTDGGETWVQLPDAGWTKRYYQTGVALQDGSIVIMGGYDGTRQNDVWCLQPAGSTAENPQHDYSAPGTYTVALQAYNAGGYDATRKVGYITVTGPTPTPTATPTSPPPSRSSGGGGGGSTGGPDYNVGGDSAVSRVTVTGTGLNMLIVTGWKQSSPGSGIPPAPPIVYQYIDLTPARFETITGANITFSIPAAWLAENGFTPGEIVMYHYNGTAWEALPTWIVDDSGTAVTFRAASPGFSLFAISGIVDETAMTTLTATQTTPQATAQPTATETAAVPAAPAPDFPLGTVALIGGAILLLIGAGYFARRWWIIRQNPMLFQDYD